MNFEPEISISLSEILVAVLSIIAAGFGYIIKEQRDRIKSIQIQLSEKKYQVYHQIYSIFFDLFKQQKGMHKEESITEIGSKLIDVKKDLFIYAPDNVIKKFIEWNSFVSNQPNDLKHVLLFLDVAILIRKDMGNKHTIITNLDILRSIMTTDEEFEKFKRMILE